VPKLFAAKLAELAEFVFVKVLCVLRVLRG
jgi:hypothetical protein